VVGRSSVEVLLKTHAKQISKLQVKSRDDVKLQPLIHQAQSLGIYVEPVGMDYLEEIADGVPHQGVIAVCKAFEPKPFEVFLKEFKAKTTFNTQWPFVLALDQVTDPRNFGAIIRCAVAAKVDAILLPKHHRAELNAAAFRASAGVLPLANLVEVTNLTDAIEKLKPLGLWWVAASMEPPKGGNVVPYYQMDFCQPIGLVMGSEGKGIRDRIVNHCDYSAWIPMAEAVESLNVSVASGILVFEALRQRQLKQ